MSLEGMAIPHCPIRMDLRGCAMSPKNYTESKSGIVWLARMAVATKKFRVWGLECMLISFNFPSIPTTTWKKSSPSKKSNMLCLQPWQGGSIFHGPSASVEKGLAKGDCPVIPNRALLFLGGYVGGLVVGPWDFLTHTFRGHSQGNCGARPRKDGEQRGGGEMLSGSLKIACMLHQILLYRVNP